MIGRQQTRAPERRRHPKQQRLCHHSSSHLDACLPKLVPLLRQASIETESLDKLARRECPMAERRAVNVRESGSKFAEQAQASQHRLLVPEVPPAEPAAEPSSSAEAERPVPEDSDCQFAAGGLAVEQVAAGTGKAERPAAEATVVVGSVVAAPVVAVPVVAVRALSDKLAGTAADGLPLVVAGTLVVPVDIGDADGTPVEVQAAGADAAADTVRPADSGSRMEPAVVGTAEPVDATVVAERTGSALGFAGQSSPLKSTSSSRHSTGTDSRQRLPSRIHCSHKDCMTKHKDYKMEHTVHNTKKRKGCSTNSVLTACIALGL